MYVAARNLGIAPSEFWEMTLGELMLEVEARAAHDPARHFAGGLTAGDIEDLLNMDA